MKFWQKVTLGVALLIMCIFAANHTINRNSYYAVADLLQETAERVTEGFRLFFETDVMKDAIGKMYYVDGMETTEKKDLDLSRDVRRVYISMEKKQLIDETNDYSVILPRDTLLSFLPEGVKAPHDDFALRITRLSCTAQTLEEELDRTWRSEDYAFAENFYIREARTEERDGVTAEIFTGAHLDDPDNGFAVICLADGEDVYELKFYGNLYSEEFETLCRETVEQFRWR